MQVRPNLNESPRCGINEAAAVVAHPVASGHSAGTPRLSNLDCNGRIVKKGCVVSSLGFRLKVQRVRMGQCWGVELDAFGNVRSRVPAQVACKSVQVVA